jgi:hypothetical protein
MSHHQKLSKPDALDMHGPLQDARGRARCAGACRTMGD